MKIATIGFTKKSAQRFFELIRHSGSRRIVDVRLNGASQLAGFAKKNDLAWFAQELCGVEYTHEPCLAPTKDILSNYRAKRITWSQYEKQFIDLLKERRVESVLRRDTLDDSCLLCSEDQPHHCHRRFVAEYLQEHWGDVEIRHLGLKKEFEEDSAIDSGILRVAVSAESR